MSSENRAIRFQPFERLVPPLKIMALLMLLLVVMFSPAAATLATFAVAIARSASVT